MRKEFFLTAIGISLSFLIVAPMVLARPSQRLDSVTQTTRIFSPETIEEGRELFKSVCKRCHTNDNAFGAPFLHSESKSSKEWNRIFEKRYPACANDGSWIKLSAEQIMRINDFLFMNASDSFNPQSGKDSS